jgi:hypothetical protein
MIGKPLSSSLLVACLFFLSFGTEGKDPKTHTSGSIKSYFIAVDSAEISGNSQYDDSTDGIVQNSLRLRFTCNPADYCFCELAYDLLPTLRSSSSAELSGLLSNNPVSYRVVDLDRDVYSSGDEGQGRLVLAQNLDRLYMTLSPSFADIHLGRQAVAFGSARVINPTDVICPYGFYELNTEDRTGVDAVRAQVPIGAMGEFDVGIIAGDDFETEESAAFVRTKLYALNTDFTFLALGFKENLLCGVDVAGSIGGAGYWIEAAHTFSGAFDDRNTDQDFFRLSTGLDYSFNVSNGILAYIEYHYNGASEGNTADYIDQMAETAYQEAGVYLLGRHYAAPGIVWNIMPLLVLDSSLLWNLDDESTYLSMKLEYNLSENVYIGMAASIASGEESELIADEIHHSDTVNTRSEFGLYPDLYYTYVRLYF